MLNVVRFLPAIFLIFSISFSAYSQEADIAKGKSLFNANCAACHKLNKNLVGPALAGVSEKYEKDWLYSWIKNSAAMIKAGDERAVAIWEEYNKAAMNAFPQLSNEDIDNILAYTDYKPEPVATVATAAGSTTGAQAEGSVSTDIILIVLIVILCVLVVMLFLVNKTLKAIAEKNGIKYEEKNQSFLCQYGNCLLEINSLFFVQLCSCFCPVLILLMGG